MHYREKILKNGVSTDVVDKEVKLYFREVQHLVRKIEVSPNR